MIKHDRIVMRTCFACRQKLDKSSMLRLVVDGDGVIWPDVMQKAPGRGIYMCMEEACIAKVDDKRMGSLRGKYGIVLPQWYDLQTRLLDVFSKYISLQLTHAKVSSAIGRDAVMHQMWKTRPQLLLLAEDAGDALVRQVMDAVSKRHEEGLKTLQLNHMPEGLLASVFQRQKVSVVALPVSKSTAKLQRYCAWYGRIKGKQGK